MREANLFDLIQNSVVGAIALHSFTVGYNVVAKAKNLDVKFPKLSSVFYVLPITYHSDSLNVFRSSTELYTAILKDQMIVVGLQERAYKLSLKTFDSLNMAFSKRLLTINKETLTVETIKGIQSTKISLPASINYKENSIQRIQDTAFRLGHIFAKRDPGSIQFELNISF